MDNVSTLLGQTNDFVQKAASRSATFGGTVWTAQALFGQTLDLVCPRELGFI